MKKRPAAGKDDAKTDAVINRLAAKAEPSANGHANGKAGHGQSTPQRGRDWSKLFITSAEFAERDTRPNWLVKQVLVADQPAVIAGPQKVLKTSFLVDLVISLATGTPFLGRFETIGKLKVAMLSGESGDDTLKRTAERVSDAKSDS